MKAGSGTSSHGRIVPPPPQKSGTFKPPKADEDDIFADDEAEIFEEDEVGPDDEPEHVGIAPGESLAKISSGKLPRLVEQQPQRKAAPQQPPPNEDDVDEDEEEAEAAPRVLGMPQGVAIGVLGGAVVLLVGLVVYMNFLR